MILNRRIVLIQKRPYRSRKLKLKKRKSQKQPNRLRLTVTDAENGLNTELEDKWKSTLTGTHKPHIRVSGTREKNYDFSPKSLYFFTPQTGGLQCDEKLVWRLKSGDKLTHTPRWSGKETTEPATKKKFPALTLFLGTDYTRLHRSGLLARKVPLKKEIPQNAAHDAYDDMLELERETVRVENELYYDEDLLDDYRKDMALKKAISRSKEVEKALRAKMKRERR
eukprot:734343_1